MKEFDYSLVKNPEYFKDGRMEAHSDHITYANVEEASTGETSYRHSLNGIWKFHYARNYGNTIKGFEREDYSCKDWDDIRVPAHIQMEGYDAPQYANVQYPWEGHEDIHPGEIPEHFNPVASYVKYFTVPEQMKGKRLFIRFEGVNNIADVFINRRHIGEHRGGYGAFIFEITGKVEYGKENSILVRVNNGEQLDIMPLVGDFNFYGGIYRDVHLLITDETCISPLDYASPGVRLIQDSVSHRYAKVRAIVDLSNGSSGNQEVELNVRLLDGQRVVKEGTKNVNLSGNEVMQQELTFEIDQPHLWNGRQDPFLYQAEVTLFRNGQMVDRVTQPLGLRFYRIDPDKGFFLNGKHLPLQGVCRHQDRSEVGNALRPQHHEEDVALMLEMGVNAVRLAHYPQATYFYDLMDKKRNILIRELMDLIDEAKDIQEEIDTTFTRAYACLQRANIQHGISKVEELAYTVPIEDSIQIQTRSIMGTEIPHVKYDAHENQLTYAMDGTFESIDVAREAFRQVKDLTIKLSMVENAAYRLATSIKKTQKRANALKNITIPTYTGLVYKISNELEEKEREEFTRLKVIKRMKQKNTILKNQK